MEMDWTVIRGNLHLQFNEFMTTDAEDQYKTIRESSEGLFKDRGSKFFAYLFPIRTEEDFKERLDEIKKEHYQARHHCYAWRLNPEDIQYRANDDGEPSHSAGTPILHALQSAELVNVGAVVVRYFGGTKLGVGGLINAYRSATDEAIKEVTIRTELLEHGGILTTDYAHMSSILHLFDKLSVRIEKQVLEYDCTYHIAFRQTNLAALESAIEPLENTTFVRKF